MAEESKMLTEQENYAIWRNVESFMEIHIDENMDFITSMLDPRKGKEWNAKKAAEVVAAFKEALVAQVIDVESCILAMEEDEDLIASENENQIPTEGGTNETGSK